MRRPSPPDRSDPRVVVLLAVDGEPPRYDGPQYWAQAYRLRQAHGEPAPHWFVRPLVYSRIRAAYATMGGQHPLEATLIQASAALQEHMGAGYVVRHAYLEGHPQLTRSLVSLADEGFRCICLVCLASLTSEEARLHQAVSDSRVREFGIRVTYASAPGILLGAEDLYSDHLQTLVRGHPLSGAPEVADSQMERISACVLQSMNRESGHKGSPSKA